MKLVLVFTLIVLFEFGNGRRGTQTSSMEYYTKQRHAININIMVHMDPALTKKLISQNRFRTRKKLKETSFRILKDVERLFQHSTLNQTIRFRLIDTKFLKNRSNVVRIDENASKYLRSYCKWQSGKKIQNKRWYYSVLLTGLDVFYVNNRGEEVRRSAGRSYMASMCDMMKSCTLIEWHPKNIGFLLAHEIAHSLNIGHDGPPFNGCKDNFIMTSKYNDRNHPKAWSTCSQRALNQFLQSGKSWCIKSKH